MEVRNEQRRRRRTTACELEILELEFKHSDKPSITERERISERIRLADVDGPGMNAREIQVWFQNKRQAIRRAQGPMDKQSTPNTSFIEISDGLPTPSSSQPSSQTRRAKLILSDLDGHAEVMFSPTPLKPSSPPRIPVMITPMKTPFRKPASRSVSSPALLPSVLGESNGNRKRPAEPAITIKKLKLGRQKENIPPNVRDIRRIQSFNYARSSSDESDLRASSLQGDSSDKLSAEECALSLVGLARSG